jgi:hypothetical protein
MITITPVLSVRVELVHPKLMEYLQALLDAEIYSLRGTGFSHWKAGQQGVPLEREMWVTGGNYDPADEAELRRIHDEVAAT